MKLWFDTETGGLDANKHTILSAYFVVTDENLNIIDDLELKLKPDSIDDFLVDEESVKVHGIDPIKHLEDPETITYSEGRKKLVEFLTKNKKKRVKFIPSGHNIAFDINFLTAQLIDSKTWNKFTTNRSLDTLTVTTFLKDLDFIPSDMGTLTSLVDYFGVQKRDAHDAKNDVLMNIEVYKKMTGVFKKSSMSFGEGIDKNLLDIVEL